MAKIHVVKRNGQIEPYDRSKLHQSIVAACLSVRTPEGSAEDTAKIICNKTEQWLCVKAEVTSADIRRKSAEAMVAYNREAAYIYKQRNSL